jgi:hypothetical protein
MAPDEPRIIERDGDVVRIVAGAIEVIARLTRSGDDLILEGFSIDGAGPGSVGMRRLRELARRFAADQGARRLIIRGTTRTTGASPGKRPREVIIVV